MKLREYKENIQGLYILAKSCLIYNFQTELAYPANNWGNLLSTMFFNISSFIFINVLYSNVKVFAGYNYNEMLFFFFIGQITFYTMWCFYMEGIKSFIEEINNGWFDFVLLKPVSSLFYVLIKKNRIFQTLRDGLPPVIIIGLLIEWEKLSFTFINLFSGILIGILGIICLQFIIFLAVIPAFYWGKSIEFFNLVNEVSYEVGGRIPWEGFSQIFKIIFISVIPLAISVGLTTSALLGKINGLSFLGYVFLLTIILIILENIIWKNLLKHYSSASS